jgi:sugar lactone lactonase YvrE
MMELFEHADPAAGVDIDKTALRARIDEKIGLLSDSRPIPTVRRRPWVMAAASFAAVTLVAVLVAVLRRDAPSPMFSPDFQGIRDLPGIDLVVPLASGGVQTAAVDGETIWVMTALQNQLQRVSVLTGDVEATYSIDGYVEGVVVGGRYVWLLSYDNGGEVLRFDPASGRVDLTIPIDGSPWHSAAWFADSLWVSNDQGDLHHISTDGEILSTSRGELKGDGLGYLWVNDPDTGLISSLAEDGTRGEIVIPTRTGLVTADGWGVRSVTEASGFLWLMDGDYPFGTNLSIFDPATGELSSFAGLTFGLLDMVEFDESLWVTSHTDHMLMRVDPESREVQRFPMPGKAGGLVVANGSLWVTLYHPGALVRLDPSAGMIETGEIVADDWNRFPHRLLCTGSLEAGGPTVILEPYDWIDYGSWSVIQAELSNEGHLVCANGYLEGEASPAQRAADLDEALTEAGIPGPYILVAAGDGVHSTRLFADGRDDIAGVVLVDPMPIGFQDYLDRLLPDGGHAPWHDLDPAVSEALDDFADLPVVVIGGNPQAGYLSQQFIDFAGRETAGDLNDAWQDGLAFYAGLSTDSRFVVAHGSGHQMFWDQPELVVEQVFDMLSQVAVG